MLPMILMIEIVQYTTEVGQVPFQDWFDNLGDEAVLKITTALSRIEGGNLGDVKPVGQGVLERRIDFGPGYRIYFGWDGDKCVILLCGGTKKRQSRDIKHAKANWADYNNRKRKGRSN